MNGYIYSKGTKAGFLRMQRMGIPRPLFRIEDKLAKVARTRYKALVRQLLWDLKYAAAGSNVTLDKAPDDEDETLQNLLDFFEQMRKESEDLNKDVNNRANMGAAENTLQHKWLDGDQDQVTDKVKEQVEKVLQEEQDDYLQRLYKDAGQEMQELLLTFSLDKQQVFNDNMDKLRALYLDNSIERMTWEEDYIKRGILNRIHRYVTGEDKTLHLDDLTKYAYERGEHIARLFARDQMQRFNKALTLSTFVNAGVTKVKWVTSHDARVRPEHKALDGQVFDINNLPDEVDDYNCRCGLVPVEWAE